MEIQPAIEAHELRKTYISGVQAAREAAVGARLDQIAGLVAGELAVGMLWALGGYLLFRQLENYARRGGLQEAY